MTRVLIVEDEVLLRFLTAEALQDSGLEVQEAGSAAEAIEILEADPGAIDLVFSDVRMPGSINGIGLLRWARTNRPALPVILTSAYHSGEEAVRQLGGDEPFIPKPYDPFQVASQIREMVKRRH
jgi:DNA-binding NtrC family response regulator